jgi:hypothetical protein
VLDVVEDRRRAVDVRGPARQADVEQERHEPWLGAVVEVALELAAGGVGGVDEAHARSAQLRDIGAQRRREALPLEREADRRARGAHEPGLVVESGVVADHRDRRAVALDRRPAALRRRRRLDGGALRVDVAAELRHPVADLERRVAQRLGQRVAQAVGAERSIEPLDQLAHRLAR